MRARNGGWTYLTFGYWLWIRHIAAEEGVSIPDRGQRTEVLSAKEARAVASALWIRADKIRKGLAPRDATAYLEELDRKWSPKVKLNGYGSFRATFDDPDDMDETADFFDVSGGATLVYERLRGGRKKPWERRWKSSGKER